jgi:hypothetical protein
MNGNYAGNENLTKKKEILSWLFTRKKKGR